MAIELPLLTKPRFRIDACNGCGLCCSLSLCDGALLLFPGAKAPCPALEYENGRTFCGIIRHPEQIKKNNGEELSADDAKEISNLFVRSLSIGTVCTMPDEYV